MIAIFVSSTIPLIPPCHWLGCFSDAMLAVRSLCCLRLHLLASPPTFGRALAPKFQLWNETGHSSYPHMPSGCGGRKAPGGGWGGAGHFNKGYRQAMQNEQKRKRKDGEGLLMSEEEWKKKCEVCCKYARRDAALASARQNAGPSGLD